MKSEEKKKYIKMPPEATDGDACCVHPVGCNTDYETTLGQFLMDWAERSGLGETIKLEIIEMTGAEVESLGER